MYEFLVIDLLPRKKETGIPQFPAVRVHGDAQPSKLDENVADIDQDKKIKCC